MSDENFAAAALVLSGLASSASSLLIATDILRQKQVAVGANVLGGVLQALIRLVPFIQRQVHGVAIVLVTELEDGLAMPFLYAVGDDVVEFR